MNLQAPRPRPAKIFFTRGRGGGCASRRAMPGCCCRPVGIQAVRPVSCAAVDKPSSMPTPRTTAATSESAAFTTRTRSCSMPIVPLHPDRPADIFPSLVESWRASSIGPSPSRPRCRRSAPVDNPRPDLIPFQTRTVRPLQGRPRIPTGPCFPGPERRPSARPNDLSRKIRHASQQIVANLGRHD